MRWLTSFAGYCAPLFLIMSPVLSYSDQALSMHRNKSSAGFSLDIPLIMLVASFFRCDGSPSAPLLDTSISRADALALGRIFYYPGARFDSALLIQSFLMVGMQLLLLKIALDHRPGPASKGGDAALPFAGASKEGFFERQRPYQFWQWRSPKPYVVMLPQSDCRGRCCADSSAL